MMVEACEEGASERRQCLFGISGLLRGRHPGHVRGPFLRSPVGDSKQGYDALLSVCALGTGGVVVVNVAQEGGATDDESVEVAQWMWYACHTGRGEADRLGVEVPGGLEERSVLGAHVDHRPLTSRLVPEYGRM